MLFKLLLQSSYLLLQVAIRYTLSITQCRQLVCEQQQLGTLLLQNLQDRPIYVGCGIGAWLTDTR